MTNAHMFRDLTVAVNAPQGQIDLNITHSGGRRVRSASHALSPARTIFTIPAGAFMSCALRGMRML